MRKIVVGSRQSALALTQTGQVIDQLRAICAEHGYEVDFEIKKIVTKGDRILDVTLSKVGGKGLFVKEIEQALMDGEIDMAVHSMKDMPFDLPEGLIIGAVPERVDPRDCLISRGGIPLRDLPQGARIGTSSLRRSSQLKQYRPDFQMEWIRGNIDTRIKKIETEGLDGVILATAGLLRMGWQDRISEYLDKEICLPAVGQGALAVECREDDEQVLELLMKFHHTPTYLTVSAERSFLGRLNGGCQVPIGAYAELLSGEGQPMLTLTGLVGDPDGGEIIKETMAGDDPMILGRQLAEKVIGRGADRVLAKMGRELP
jgi:hydroxymethylbilane synthase